MLCQLTLVPLRQNATKKKSSQNKITRLQTLMTKMTTSSGLIQDIIWTLTPQPCEHRRLAQSWKLTWRNTRRHKSLSQHGALKGGQAWDQTTCNSQQGGEETGFLPARLQPQGFNVFEGACVVQYVPLQDYQNNQSIDKEAERESKREKRSK